MRIIVLFDLPTSSAQDRRNATKFRNFLLKDGYYMVQFSIYTRVCNGNDAVEKHVKRIKNNLPPQGAVRLLTVTEKQYQNMQILVGKPSINDMPMQAEQMFCI